MRLPNAEDGGVALPEPVPAAAHVAFRISPC
jgi:hypothetical protein